MAMLSPRIVYEPETCPDCQAKITGFVVHTDAAWRPATDMASCLRTIEVLPCGHEIDHINWEES